MQVGSAHTPYTLDVSGVRQGVTEAKALLADLQAAAESVRQQLARPIGPTGGGGGSTGTGGASTAAGAADIKNAQAAQRLATEQARTAQAQARAEQASLKLAAAQNKTAISTAKTATEEAKAAQAAQRLATEQQRTAQVAARVEAEQNRTAMSALRLAQAQERAAGAGQRQNAGLLPLPRTLHDITGPALGAVQAITGIGGALGALQGAYQLGQAGAQAALVEQRFNGLAQAAHTTGDALLNALRAASGGEIADLNLQLAANRAQMLGVANSAEQFSTLMAIARDRAQALGSSTGQAFDDLITGLGRGSAEILDNLGIMINAEEVTKQYASSLGKSAEALTAAERKQAIINAVLKQGQETIAKTGGAIAGTAGQFAQFTTGWENAKNAIGGVVASGLGPWLSQIGAGLNVVSQALKDFQASAGMAEQAGQRAFSGSTNFQDYTNRVRQVNDQLSQIGRSVQPLTAAQYAYAQSLMATGTAADQAFQKAAQQSQVAQQLVMLSADAGRQNADLKASFDALGPSILAAAATSDANRDAVLNMVGALMEGTMTAPELAAQLNALTSQHEQHLAVTSEDSVMLQQLAGSQFDAATAAQQHMAALAQQIGATQQKTAADQQAQAQTEMLASAQQTLVALGGAVAGGFMTASSAASQMAAQYGIAYGAALLLIKAQAALGQTRVDGRGIQGPAAGGADGFGQMATSSQLAAIKAAKARQRERAEAAKAEVEYQKVLGNYRPAVAQAQAELEKLRKAGKAGTADYINQQAELARLQQQAESAAKRGGGKGRKGGGAGKLTDAQKLQRGLEDIQVSSDNKRERESERHERKVKEIEKKFQEERLAQDREYRNARLDGDLDFYENLSQIQDQELARQASARREAAALEADEIARTKGGAAAQRYLDEQEKAIADETRRMEKIRQLRSKYKDNGDEKSADERKDDENKAQYEENLLEMARRRNQQRIDDAKNAEDKALVERQRALDEENERYQQAMDDIGEASDQATAKKIRNSKAAAQAADEETAAYKRQAEQIAKTGGSGRATDAAGQKGAPSGSTSAGAPPSGTPTATETARSTPGGARSSLPLPLNDEPRAAGAQASDLTSAITALRADFQTLAEQIGQVESAVRNTGRENVTATGRVENAIGSLAGAVRP